MVAILPMAREMTAHNFMRVARLWSVVFLGNVVGTVFMAALAAYAHLQSNEVLGGMLAVAGKLREHTPLETLTLAIPAGFTWRRSRGFVPRKTSSDSGSSWP